MANTEGVSDEAIENLLSVNDEQEHSSTSAGSHNNIINNNNKKKSALARRMELPMGERPAARVIRSSTRTRSHRTLLSQQEKSVIPGPASPELETSSTVRVHVVAGDADRSTTRTAPTSLSSSATGIIMGDVIERRKSSSSFRRRKQQQVKSSNTIPVRASSSSSSSTTTTTSRFAKTASKSGFPSIHVPLGQLVNPKTTMSQRRMDITNDTSLTKQTNNNNNNKNDETTTEIQRQAQAMLEQMSPEEIKEQVQDLKAALSPETIAFLKQRGQRKQKRCNVPQEPVVRTENSPRNDTETTDSEKSNSNPDDSVEKRRLAQVLSSIRTYEDMDTAYNQEVKERFEFLGLTSSTDKIADNDPFSTACDLLRSSVPRQSLWAARFVSQRLQQDVRQDGSEYAIGNDRAKPWPYPVLLPVSLRCLLDAPVSKVNGSVLHTYVLQALYALLRLRSSRDHVHGIVDGENNNEAALLYQEYFLDDAIPTPPLHTCYSSIPIRHLNQGNNDSNNSPPVAYATTSSSTSAQQDGQAFVQDPLWTLLSRMRILPRLAQLMIEEQLTVEAVVALCGILTLVAQRTPGAATAIVQHPTLLRDLSKRTLEQHQIEENSALETLFLGCTLARQSRIAAQGLDTVLLPRVLPLFVSSTTSLVTQQKHSLQKWAVVLWRTRLRYGLSLVDLPTILTLAAPHCALGVDHQEGQNLLAPYFFSAFTSFLHCIRSIKRIRTHSQNEKDAAVNSDDRSLLLQAGIWLSSSKRQALQHFVHASSIVEATPSTEKELRWLQYLTSILHYLDAWLILSRSDVGEEIGEFKTEDITETEEDKCLRAILSFFEEGSVKNPLRVALQHCFRVELSELPAADGAALAYEAGSCAFVDALLALATSISTSSSDANPTLLHSVREKILEYLQSLLSDCTVDDCSSPKRSCFVEISRRHWLNRTHTSLVRFLATTAPDFVDSITQAVGLSVIGRLEKGEESLAALLFSCDNLFRKLEPAEASRFISPISTFFVREMCLTEHARLQLDHSFKLRNALGLTSDKMGPFDTQSLRSEADGIPQSGAKDLLLPMGNLWLWKIFGGTIVDQELSQEAGQVLLTALELVNELETAEELARQVYVQSLNVGGRLYFLMNICFQPFLGQEQIIFLVNNLVDRYAKELDDTSALGFAEECELHSADSSSKKKDIIEDQSSEERQVEQLLNPSVPSTDKVWKQNQLRSVESFIGDLCDAFLDYGAQYPFFTKCLRSFLCSGFPSVVRCKLIERLRDVPHLLALPEEKDLTSSLLVCLNGGRPSLDRSVKDTPDILDACTSLFTKGKKIRSDAFFVLSWATAMLARSLAIHLEEGREGGLAVSRRRISSLGASFAHGVLLATEEFLASNGTKQDLVDISVRCCREAGDGTELLFSDGDDHNWDQVLLRLRKSFTEGIKSLE